LSNLLAPIQTAYQGSTEWQEIALKAYPPPPKKEKKVKDKGTRHPGVQNKKELPIQTLSSEL
jgi:tyrosyl-tRNA synthetase